MLNKSRGRAGAGVMITGGSGQLGKELVRVFPGALHPTHAQLDITSADAVLDYISRTRPTMLIHCAALTDVRECERDKAKAVLTNVTGTVNLVRACENYDQPCTFVYLSTACVFYGDRGSYVEDDIPYPKNFYAVTKLEAETVILYSRLKRWLIIRTNFVARKKWAYPKAFVDRYGTYLFADDLARAIKVVLARDLTGIVHIAGERKMSMYDLAKLTTPKVQEMTIAEYDGPPLTMDMSLNSSRISAFKISNGIQKGQS